MTPGDPAAPEPDPSGNAMDQLRQVIDAACMALAEAAATGREVGSRRAQLDAAGRHLDQASRLVERGRQELTAAAAEIVRASLPEGACGVPWPACRRCLGTGLTTSAESSWCPSCGQPGDRATARSAYLCTERATVKVREESGAEAAMCLSHAAGALRCIDRLTVTSATDDELQAIIFHSYRPIRVDTSGQAHRLGLVGRER